MRQNIVQVRKSIKNFIHKYDNISLLHILRLISTTELHFFIIIIMLGH